jgi:murein DD-endopeptidase MepM/ murein hydrolase activator NlpD
MRILIAALLAGPVLMTPGAGGPALPAAPAATWTSTLPSTPSLPSSWPNPSVPSFGWPLTGSPVVTRPFDPPEHPYGPGHRGVDLRGSPGEQVVTAGDGIVAFAGMVAGRPVVSVDHPNGLRTTYEPVVAAVSIGQRVRRGDVLGALQAGHAGCPAAACLHWGVRRGEEYLDPLGLLASGRVRLLPMPP